MISTLFLSVVLEWLGRLFPNGIANLESDLMLVSTFGGIIVGLGLGMVFKVGGTTGGTDLAGAMISNRFPTFSIAKAMAVIDLFIVIMSGVVAQKPQIALYSLIAVFFCMRVSDMIVDGFDSYKGLMIISNNPDELGHVLMNELARGVTILKGAGMYSKQDKPILLCVVHRVQVTKAREIINRVDNQAFVMVTDMKEVFGNGFLPVGKKG